LTPRKTVAVAAVAGILAALLGAVPASANPVECSEDDNLCLYDGTGYSGGWIWFELADTYYPNNDFDNGVDLNDHVSSIYNADNRRWRFHTDSFFNGASYTISSFSIVGTVPHNNQYSSHTVAD
jgi:hypothetical protein